MIQEYDFASISMRLCRFILGLVCALHIAGCGDLFFSSDADVSTLEITRMTVEVLDWQDTIVVGDSAVGRVRVLTQAAEDVTSFVDDISWSIAPTTVAALARGKDMGKAQRLVRAIDVGIALVEIVATYTNPDRKVIRSSPIARSVVVTAQ